MCLNCKDKHIFILDLPQYPQIPVVFHINREYMWQLISHDQVNLPSIKQCGANARTHSYGSIPEYRLLFRIGWRAVLLCSRILLPAGQDGHAILFAKALFRFLSSLYFFAQATLFLNHLKHCMVSMKPLHACHLAKKKEWIQKKKMEWKCIFCTGLYLIRKLSAISTPTFENV